MARTATKKTTRAIDNIKVEWTESNAVADGVMVETVAAFDEILKAIAVDKDPGGGYCKTKFTVTLCDGSQYTGRIDIHYINCPQETDDGNLGLLNHIATSCRHTINSDAGYIKQEQKDSCRQWCLWLGIDLEA
tara:strand:+ start:53930 stop:54328 length:399 start_codon:yes stop_codon:yes gene_type:complete